MVPGRNIYFPTICVVVPLKGSSRDIFSTQGFTPMQGEGFQSSLFREIFSALWIDRYLSGTEPPTYYRKFGPERANQSASES